MIFIKVEWSLNVGEQVIDIFVSRFSRSLTSIQIDIIVLCERSMFCLKESGTIRFQKRFDYPTACCFPYPSTHTQSTMFNNKIPFNMSEDTLWGILAHQQVVVILTQMSQYNKEDKYNKI
jgi:PTHB1 N-terminus